MKEIEEMVMKDGKPLFFLCLEDEKVLCHPDFFRPPVLVRSGESGEWFVGAGERMSPPTGVTLGTRIRAVCDRGPNGLRAVQWCLADQFAAGWRELTELRAAAHRRREELAAARREELAANPRTPAQAVALGWRIVSKSGRQVILERIFQGESRPRRITCCDPKPKKKKPEDVRCLQIAV